MSRTKLAYSILGVVAIIGIILAVLSQMNRTTSPSWDVRNEEARLLSDQQKRLAEEIKIYTQERRCKKNAQCHVLALGPKICDHRTNYLIYSTMGKKGDQTSLFKKSQEFNQNATRLYKLSLKVGKCGSPPPKTACIQKTCQPIKR